MTRMVRAAALTNYFDVAQQVGLNPLPLLSNAGLSRAMLDNPDHKIPASAVVTLLEESARAADCQSFGLRMAETRQISDFGAVGLLIMAVSGAAAVSCRPGGRARRRAADYFFLSATSTPLPAAVNRTPWAVPVSVIRTSFSFWSAVAPAPPPTAAPAVPAT